MAYLVAWAPVITPGAPKARYGCSMVSTISGLQVFGGYASSYLNEFLALSTTPDAKKWRLRRKSRPYPAGRRGHILLDVNDHQILFGGDLGSECVNDLWLCTGGEWRQMISPSNADNIPSGRYGHAGCIMGTSLYLFGGADRYQHTSMLADLWVLNLLTLRWEKSVAGPAARYGHSMLTAGDDIFVIGGMTQAGLTNDLWRLVVKDNREMSWVQMTATSEATFPPRTEFFAFALSRYTVLLFGGSSDEAPLNDMWLLNLNLEMNTYVATYLQASVTLPVPRHAFGAAYTTIGNISGAKIEEITSELEVQSSSVTWLNEGGQEMSQAYMNSIRLQKFDGLSAKFYVFGGRGADASLNDLWECTLCLLEHSTSCTNISEIRAAEHARIDAIGNSLSNINYPPNSDIDLCRSCGGSFVEYNSYTLEGHTTGLYTSNLTSDRSFSKGKSDHTRSEQTLFNPPSTGSKTGRRPSVPRFPEADSHYERHNNSQHFATSVAVDARGSSYIGSNSINDPSLLSNNNPTHPDQSSEESMGAPVYMPRQNSARRSVKGSEYAGSEPSGALITPRTPTAQMGTMAQASPYRQSQMNGDHIVQPTDDVQRYLMGQVISINENLLRMEAAFKVDEVTRKFTEDLEKQEAAVEDLGLAVTEFKDDVMRVIENLTQKLAGYSSNQQAHEDDIIELNNKLTELDDLIVKQANDTTRDDLLMEMQVRIKALTDENKALTARLTSVEALLAAVTLASKPSEEIMTLLNAVVTHPVTPGVPSLPAVTLMSSPIKKTKAGKSDLLATGVALKDVYEEIKEMGKKLTVLTDSVGAKQPVLSATDASQVNIQENIVEQFRQQLLSSPLLVPGPQQQHQVQQQMMPQMMSQTQQPQVSQQPMQPQMLYQSQPMPQQQQQQQAVPMQMPPQQSFHSPIRQSIPEQTPQWQVQYNSQLMKPQGQYIAMSQATPQMASQAQSLVHSQGAGTRAVPLSRSSGSLIPPTAQQQGTKSRPTSAFLSVQGRSRSSSITRGPSKESLAMIEKVLNASENLSDD